MNILTQPLTHSQPNFTSTQLSDFHEQTKSPFFTSRSTSNYTNMVELIGKDIYQSAIQSLQFCLEDMDLSFRNSMQRKHATISRTQDLELSSLLLENALTVELYTPLKMVQKVLIPMLMRF